MLKRKIVGELNWKYFSFYMANRLQALDIKSEKNEKNNLNTNSTIYPANSVLLRRKKTDQESK